MDGLSAVGLASNILQFVDFASTLVGKGVEIYKSAEGSTFFHGDLRSSVGRLQALSSSIQSRPLVPRDEDEIEIVKIASQCHQIAAELKKALEGLVAAPNSWSSSAWKALRSVWDQPKIDDMAKRLEMCRNDLHLHLSKALLNQQSFMQRSMDDLKSDNELLGLKSDDMMARFQFLKEDLLEALKPARTGGINRIASTLITQEKLGALYSGGEDIVKTADMLRALRFSRMSVRRLNVVERHKTTFDWVFERAHAEQALHFSDWLANGKGIYWITGNPGSGKSTLMKFIYLDPRTKQYLLTWTRNNSAKNLIMADFFFWKPGMKLEQSQEGLLRGLLHEVLRMWPEIMPQVLGERWCEWIVDRPWTLNELRTAIEILGQQPESHTKLCFFIDGLDEYEGQSHEIAQTVADIAKSPNIKVCLSSRPWNVFESAFGSQPKRLLRVHEHTQDDIRLYVHEVLGQHKVYKQLEAEDVQYERVLQKIVHKAKGVFLWVFLVVRNLEEVLPNEDTVESLEQTIDEFPSELEPYFERMLDSIAGRYHEPSAAMLSMMMDSEDLLPLVLVVHITAQSDKTKLQVRPPSDRQIHLPRKLRARLKAYCGDLVTIVTEDSSGFKDVYQRVDFLHRTVDDFLRSPSIRDKIRERLPKTFNPSLTIIECSTSYIKSKPAHLAMKHPAVELLLRNASKLEKAQTPCDLSLLDQCKTALVESRVPAADFMEAAVFGGLVTYIDQRIDSPDFDGTQILIFVVINAHKKLYQENQLVLRMLRILLEHGADPNASMKRCRDKITRQVWMSHTVWTAKVTQIKSIPRYKSQHGEYPYGQAGVPVTVNLLNVGREQAEKAEKQHDAAICEVFLEYGAGYDADLGFGGTAREVLGSTFGDLPGQVHEFEQIVRRRRRQGLSWIGESAPGAPFPTWQEFTPPEKKHKRRLAFAKISGWLKL
jgi:hypothetical protein